MIFVRVIDTRFGVVCYRYNENDEITSVDLGGQFESSGDPLHDFETLLQEYFNKVKVDFESVKISLDGSEFDLRVWKACRKIPYGETKTYGEIAGEIGNPNATQAVGQALGRNKIPIVIPCHRVVGKTGLGGFAYGLKWKVKLLKLEGKVN